MASKYQTIVSSIVALLQGIDGTGSYVHDLSGDSKVQVGNPDTLPSPPYLFIPQVGWNSDFGDAPLNRYERKLFITLFGFVASSDGTLSARTYSAMDLLNDITIAIEADQSLGGEVISTVIKSAAAGFDGPDEVEELAGVYAEIEVTFYSRQGV